MRLQDVEGQQVKVMCSWVTCCCVCCAVDVIASLPHQTPAAHRNRKRQALPASDAPFLVFWAFSDERLTDDCLPAAFTFLPLASSF